MNKIQIIRKLPETKDDIAVQFAVIKEKVMNNEVDVLDFSAQISALESLFSMLKDDKTIKSKILSESEKYGSKSFTKGNAMFTIKEVGTKYDYSVCSDSEYDDLTIKITELTEKRKKREAFLKAITPETEIYGSDGIRITPPAKSSTTTVQITLK